MMFFNYAHDLNKAKAQYEQWKRQMEQKEAMAKKARDTEAAKPPFRFETATEFVLHNGVWTHPDEIKQGIIT